MIWETTCVIVKNSNLIRRVIEMGYQTGQIIKLEFKDNDGVYLGKFSFKVLPRNIRVSMTNEYNLKSRIDKWCDMGESFRKLRSAGGLKDEPQFYISMNRSDHKVYLSKSSANGQSIIGVLLDDKEND